MGVVNIYICTCIYNCSSFTAVKKLFPGQQKKVLKKTSSITKVYNFVKLSIIKCETFHHKRSSETPSLEEMKKKKFDEKR